MPWWWDRMVIVLTVVAIGLLLTLEVVDLSEATAQRVERFDLALCGLFLADFLVRLRMARGHRLRFVRSNWLDLVGAIPLVGPLRTARLMRLVRILRFARLAVLGRRLVRHYDLPVAPTQTFVNLVLATTLVWVLAAWSFFSFEEGINESITGFGDALWWSMTTLSTVGYGDLYPVTDGGRVVAVGTMIFGVGVLGILAGTIATAFVELRERGRRGLGKTRMKEHLLVLGWNPKARRAVEDFRVDPRHAGRPICIVAELPETPLAGADVSYVRGAPGHRETLERAGAQEAAVAIAFAADPADARSDHQTALTVLMLRRLNADVLISAELVQSENREHLEAAGCDAVVDAGALASSLLVRAIQDLGVGDLVEEMLSNTHGDVELYRAPCGDWAGQAYETMAAALLARRVTVVGLLRAGVHRLAPEPDLVLEASDEIFALATEPPDMRGA